MEAPGREARRIPATERTLPSGIVYQIVQSLDGQSEAFQAGSLPRHGQCLGMSAVVVTLVAGGAQTSGVERPIRMAGSGFWHLNTLTKQYCICVQELRRSEAQPMQRVGQCRELIQSGTRLSPETGSTKSADEETSGWLGPEQRILGDGGAGANRPITRAVVVGITIAIGWACRSREDSSHDETYAKRDDCRECNHDSGVRQPYAVPDDVCRDQRAVVALGPLVYGIRPGVCNRAIRLWAH